MVTGPLSETSEEKAAFEVAEKQRKNRVEALEENLGIIESHPLSKKNQFPGGIYKVFAILKGGVNIPLIDIEVK